MVVRQALLLKAIALWTLPISFRSPPIVMLLARIPDPLVKAVAEVEEWRGHSID
jgi:hypothetical protein